MQCRHPITLLAEAMRDFEASDPPADQHTRDLRWIYLGATLALEEAERTSLTAVDTIRQQTATLASRPPHAA
jgi:hypothetical protein